MFGKIALDMKYHKKKQVKDDKYMRHPIDSMTLKGFDNNYFDFGSEVCNVRLGLMW